MCLIPLTHLRPVNLAFRASTNSDLMEVGDKGSWASLTQISKSVGTGYPRPRVPSAGHPIRGDSAKV